MKAAIRVLLFAIFMTISACKTHSHADLAESTNGQFVTQHTYKCINTISPFSTDRVPNNQNYNFVLLLSADLSKFQFLRVSRTSDETENIGQGMTSGGKIENSKITIKSSNNDTVVVDAPGFPSKQVIGNPSVGYSILAKPASILSPDSGNGIAYLSCNYQKK